MYKAFKEELTPSSTHYSKQIQKMEDSKTLFYETRIILIPNPDKVITSKENARPITLMNIDTKILNKILANHIQHYVKKIIHHDQV